MKDAAVVRALVTAGPVFFFKDADRYAGLADKQLASDGEPDDSAADDKMVVFFQTSFSKYPVVKIRFTRAKTCSSIQSGAVLSKPPA